jgi:hypothetical protein
VDALCVVPIAPQKSVKIKFTEAAHGCGHLALKRLAAHLAVREDLQTDAFLQRDHVVNSAIFDLLELTSRKITGGELFLRGQEFRWPKQTSYNVGVERDHDLNSIDLE